MVTWLHSFGCVGRLNILARRIRQIKAVCSMLARKQSEIEGFRDKIYPSNTGPSDLFTTNSPHLFTNFVQLQIYQ